MTTTTLTDRYVWAAARSVPEPQRADLQRELRERIGDATDALVEAGGSPAEAERDALTGLGDPVALAAAYVDRPLQLIGPRYYLVWWRLLKVLWAIVPACVVAAVLLAQAIAGASVGEMIGAAWVSFLGVVVHIGFWTTLVFAILERTPAAPGRRGIEVPWTLDQLPEPPVEGRPRRLGDLVGSLVFLAVLAGFLVWQQFGAPWWGPEAAIPLFDPALWSFWLPYFLVLIGVEAAFAVAIYRWGWTWWLAGVNVALVAAFTIPAVWLFTSGQLMNPAALEAMEYPWGDAGPIVVTIVVFVTIGFGLWDILDGFLKARREAVRRRAEAAIAQPA